MTAETLVLGVGNVLWADEGVGPRLTEVLSARVTLKSGDIVDGGTQGLYLLPLIMDARRLLLFDAVDIGKPPGEVMVLRNDELVAVFSTRIMSLHQNSLHDLLAAAKLMDWEPEEVVLIGIQVDDADSWGGEITPVVRAAMDVAINRALEVLERWGEIDAAQAC